MGAREQAIIAKARDTLNDNDAQNYRWSNKRLMEHLNDAQDALCRAVPLVAKKVEIITNPGVSTYYLPLETVRVLSAMSGGRIIPFTSAEELDEQNPEWEELQRSQYEMIVVNQLSQYEIRPYPLISDTQTNQKELLIKLRYSAMPLALGWDEASDDSLESLVISPMWDFALRHYTIGMAFLDYGDESNMQRSVASMQFYGQELKRASQLSKKSFAKRVITSPYQARVSNSSKIIRRG